MSLSLRRKTSAFLRRVPGIMVLAYPLVRFLQPKHTIGVVAAIFNEKQEILLVEHVFHPKHPWGLPGGWLSRKESPMRTIQRELLEELELTVQVKAVAIAETTHRNHLDLAYLCYAKSEIGKISYELLNYDWFDINQLPHLNTFNQKAIQQAFELLNELESR